MYVNDTPAPIYYASYNQVNFQIPYDAPTGDVTIRIERNGTTSNRISAEIVGRAPRLLRLGIGDYAIAVNTDGSFPIPATPRPQQPSRTGRRYSRLLRTRSWSDHSLSPERCSVPVQSAGKSRRATPESLSEPPDRSVGTVFR